MKIVISQNQIVPIHVRHRQTDRSDNFSTLLIT